MIRSKSIWEPFRNFTNRLLGKEKIVDYFSDRAFGLTEIFKLIGGLPLFLLNY